MYSITSMFYCHSALPNIFFFMGQIKEINMFILATEII